MKDIHFISLPDRFTLLLQKNMQTTSSFYPSFKSYFYENKDLLTHLKISCIDLDEQGQIDRIIKAVGWHGLRNRLTHYYLRQRDLVDCTQFYDEKNLNDLLSLETRFQKFTVDGYSRLFLLGLYLKMLGGKKSDFGVDTPTLKFLEKALSITRSRTIKIDWLIMTLILLAQQLGEDLLYQKLRAKNCFPNLWEELEGVRRDNLIQGLLSYGSSINDDEFISMDLVG
jgi:hypothetical protein